MKPGTQVTHRPDAHRYELTIDGELAGHLDYAESPGVIRITHTEIDSAFGGQGAGSLLVRDALDDVRAAGGRAVVPQCPFVAAWIGRHPDYQDLLQN